MKELDRFTCEQVFKRLDDYLDRELSPEDTERIREHLEICAWCADTYKFQAEVLEATRTRLQQVTAPPSLRNKVAEALQRAAQDKAEQ